MTPRSIRRAAERKARKLERKANALAMAAPREGDAPIMPDLFNDDLYEQNHIEESLCLAAPTEPESTHSPSPSDERNTPPSISAAQLAANRANAQLSTGPATPEGKSKTSLNAVKTALTGRTVLLPTDDVAAYQHYLTAYENELRPVGRRESDLVQSIIDTTWRLLRIPCLETGLFPRGYLEFENGFDQHAPALRSSMIEVETFLKYEKQIR